jgi:inner membrane protein involved in colicin E2 resistance
MFKRIAAIVFIYLCTVLAWLVLGTTVNVRTSMQDNKLKSAVGQLWGIPQHQQAPEVYYVTKTEHKVETIWGGKTVVETRTETEKHALSLESGDVKADLKLDYRRKGLLWYSTYRVDFRGRYTVENTTGEPQTVSVQFTFPNKGAVYDDFTFAVGGREAREVAVSDGVATRSFELAPGQKESVEIGYRSQGLDEWWYEFGGGVSQVRNFTLRMRTDFDRIDFPQNGISPTSKTKVPGGWELEWAYKNLLSGVQIGMAMPEKLNPGPWVSQVTFAAPVSLFLFFFLLFIITTREGVDVHPMNYFFVGAAYFSFHLLLAYLVDHVSIHAGFVICSLVSIFLVVSYMRLVVGSRFAFLQVGLSQFVYLVVFSYTFFFEAYTGLAITALCILTLFVVMQYTARVDWGKAFRGERKPGAQA